MMKFQYYEIRPCVEAGGGVESYVGEPVYCPNRGSYISTPNNAEDEALSHAVEDLVEHGSVSMFWTLYGRDEEGLATAIGDFKSFEAAYEVLCAILAPLVEIRDKLEAVSVAMSVINHIRPMPAPLLPVLSDTLSIVEDVCNQSSSEERL